MNCIKCNDPINPKRIEILPGVKTCVNCSTTNKKVGLTLQYGEGDHTYNDLLIFDDEDQVKEYYNGGDEEE